MPVFDNLPCVNSAAFVSERRGILRGAGGALGALILPRGARAGQALPIRVLAASDLKFALADVLATFQQSTGLTAIVTYGSSGQFARQIAQGLPADLFMSADEALVAQLAAAGHTQGDGAVYAVGRLALIVPRGSAIALNGGWEAAVPAFRHALASHAITKFAIANPEHAPYGRAAQQALTALSLWDDVQQRLVRGDNIAQATQFVTTGAAQAGITALSLAIAPEVATLTRHAQVPANLHSPLRQRMVLLKSGRPHAQQLLDYLQSEVVRRRFQYWGFGQ